MDTEGYTVSVMFMDLKVRERYDRISVGIEKVD